jgi:hypothetical protein
VYNFTYLQFTRAIYIVQGWFACSDTATCFWFGFGICIPYTNLQMDYDSRASMPLDNIVEEYKQVNNNKHPLLKKCILCV